jgi:ASF1 like histone chaperone
MNPRIPSEAAKFGANELTKQLITGTSAAAAFQRAHRRQNAKPQFASPFTSSRPPPFRVFKQQHPPNVISVHTFTTTPFYIYPNLRLSSIPLKMSVVSLLGVNVLNNPAKFGDSYQFEITFECLESLQKGGLRCTSTLHCIC